MPCNWSHIVNSRGPPSIWHFMKWRREVVFQNLPLRGTWTENIKECDSFCTRLSTVSTDEFKVWFPQLEKIQFALFSFKIAWTQFQPCLIHYRATVPRSHRNLNQDLLGPIFSQQFLFQSFFENSWNAINRSSIVKLALSVLTYLMMNRNWSLWDQSGVPSTAIE